MEPISKVLQLNEQSIPAERHLTKADFSTGDEVLIRFKNKNYRGVVDFSCDDSAERDDPLALESQFTSITFALSGSPMSNLAVSTSSALPGTGQKRKCADDPKRIREIAVGTSPKQISKNSAAVEKSPKRTSKSSDAVGKSPKRTSKSSDAVGKSPKRTSKNSDAVGKRPKQIAKNGNADGKSPKHTTPRKSRKPGEYIKYSYIL